MNARQRFPFFFALGTGLTWIMSPAKHAY